MKTNLQRPDQTVFGEENVFLVITKRAIMSIIIIIILEPKREGRTPRSQLIIGKKKSKNQNRNFGKIQILYINRILIIQTKI